MTMAAPVSGDYTSNLKGESSVWRQLRSVSAKRIDRVTRGIDANVPVLEGMLRRLEPTLSLRSIRARVVAVRAETHDVNTFVLRPNARFGSFRPGSFVNVKVLIDGQKHQRSYSISSCPSAKSRTFSITVKRVQGGKVSNWLADHVKVGDVLALSAPSGQFVLPEEVPEELLMLSAGSGVTPVMSMLRQLVATQSNAKVTFVHFARSPRDIIFHAELLEIAQQMPNVRLLFAVEEADAGWQGSLGRFSEALLAEVAPNFRSQDIFMCGPGPFMKAVMQTLEGAGAELGRLRYERFSAEFDASQFLQHAQLVRFVRSCAESIASTPRTILEEAESAGVKVEWGCRAGNCGTCRCMKRSGVVTDVTTGVDSGPGAEFIFPCVSVPRGAVEVEL